MTEDGRTPVRIMLVEDQMDFRHLIIALLSRHPDLKVVAEAGSLAEARKLADTVGFDVAVLDFGLPDGDGADLIAELRRANPGVRVLILSASLDAEGAALFGVSGRWQECTTCRSKSTGLKRPS